MSEPFLYTASGPEGFDPCQCGHRRGDHVRWQGGCLVMREEWCYCSEFEAADVVEGHVVDVTDQLKLPPTVSR